MENPYLVVAMSQLAKANVQADFTLERRSSRRIMGVELTLL